MSNDIAADGSKFLAPMCQIIYSETSKSIAESVGLDLGAEDITPPRLALLREHAESTKGLFVSTSVLNDGGSLKALLKSLESSPLRLLSVAPYAVVEADDVHDALAEVQEQYATIDLLTVPCESEYVRGTQQSKGKLAYVPSIVTLRNKCNKPISVITRRGGDLAVTSRFLERQKGSVEEAHFFYPSNFDDTKWQEDLDAMSFQGSLDARKLYLHLCNTEHLKHHIDLSKIEGLTCIQSAMTDTLTESETRLWDNLILAKLANGDTKMEEIMHISNMKKEDQSSALSEATLENLATRLTGVKTFCWHQDQKLTRPLGETLAPWKDTLTSVCTWYSEDDMSFQEISDIFKGGAEIKSFGCKHNSVSRLLYRDVEHNADLEASFKENGRKLAVS